jgi:hypothetical protein
MEGKMSDEKNAPDSLADKTSDQILKEIEEKKRQLANSEPQVSQAADAVPAVEQDKQKDAAASAVEPVVEAPEKDKPLATDEEYIKKKGWKDVDSFLRSYREMERKQSQTKREPADSRPIVSNQPMNRYQPMPSNSLEETADRYGMNPEDLKKVIPLASDIAALHIQKNVHPLLSEIAALKKELNKRDERDVLRQDPAFSNPDVLAEMHDILEKDPGIFQNETAPLTFAFNEAMRSIGRRMIEGKTVQSNSSQVLTGKEDQKKPPITAGNAGKVGSDSKVGISDRVTPQNFASLPLKEQEKYLVKIGAIRER